MKPLPPNASCSTCHWFRRGHCAEPRNAGIGSVMDPGGNYRFVIDPPAVEPNAVCDFYAKPMVNNYRMAEAVK